MTTDLRWFEHADIRPLLKHRQVFPRIVRLEHRAVQQRLHQHQIQQCDWLRKIGQFPLQTPLHNCLHH